MTDADTLVLAYFRQEFQITNAAGRVLLALWNASAALSPEDLAQKAQVAFSPIRIYVYQLRQVLSPGAIPLNQPTNGPVYRLSPSGRAELDRLLVTAATELLERFRLKVAA